MDLASRSQSAFPCLLGKLWGLTTCFEVLPGRVQMFVMSRQADEGVLGFKFKKVTTFKKKKNVSRKADWLRLNKLI